MDRTRSLRRGRITAAVGLMAAVAVAIPAQATATPPVPDLPDLPDRAALVRPGKADPPPARSADVQLASGALRSIVAAAQAGQAAAEVDRSGMITVEVMYDDADAARRGIAAARGRVLGEVEGWLFLVSMPVQALAALEAAPGVGYVRVPAKISNPADPVVPIVDEERDEEYAFLTAPGEHLTKMNADEWHAAGWTGEGLKIGIVDAFSRSAWDQAQAAGELPARAGEFCQSFGVSCDWDFGITHGVGVAEVIHEMVPDAELYIASVDTTADLQAAVNWFAANGVTLVNRSLSAVYDGPGDGTGPIDAVADSAVAQGITFFNSAGNFSGQVGEWDGSYWRGGWVDADGDGWIEFDTNVELNSFYCSYILGLRWDDWGGNRTDYDLYIFDEPGDFPSSPIAASVDDQQAGADPLELTGCNPGGDGFDYMAIYLYDAGGGTGGDTLEFAVNGSLLEFWSNPYSANQPISDSANPGVVSVGAIDPALGTQIAVYSSWGPTNDERLKPDVSAASCLSGYVFSTFEGVCFNGTSAASPAALGAAALAQSAGLASSPAETTAWLYANAITDRGTAGPDDVFGRGEVILPAPPAGGGPANDDWIDATLIDGFPYVDAIDTAGATIEGWEPSSPAECSLPVPFGASVWYTYTPVANHSITVDTRGSSFDTVLVAWWYDPGANELWTIDCNDDITPAANTQSELTLDLTGGTSYYFQVAGYGGAYGDLQVNASAPGPTCGGYPATIVGTGASEVINGTAGVDVIVGGGGSDTINGGGGADIICGNSGLDTINGQGGNDVIYGGAGGDTISGGNGSDTIDGGNGADIIDGDDGNDTIEGRRAVDTIRGGPGNDTISGNDNPDVIEGGDGDDTIYGGPGADQISGDADDDTIFGQRGTDDIRGGAGRDSLDGGEGDDVIRGNGGGDELAGGRGGDVLNGGNGVDTVTYANAPGAVNVNLSTGDASGDGVDTLKNLEYVIGSAYGDTITGDGGPNVITGGGGDDDVTGKGGDDTLRGSNGNDVLRGSDGDDWLRGQAGDDTLFGGAGTDTLDGGGGSNSCSTGEILSGC